MQHLITLKEEVLKNIEYQSIAKNIDWCKIDEFVRDHIEGLILIYSKSKVQIAIDNDNPKSTIANLFGYIIEIGGALILSRIESYNLATLKIKVFYCKITALAFDRCLHNYFKENKIYSALISEYYSITKVNYFTHEIIDILASRMQAHINQEIFYKNNNNDSYLIQLYMVYLIGLTDCSYLKWL